VTAVTDLEQTLRLSQAGGADARLVAVDGSVPDCVSAAEREAPERSCGIPALRLPLWTARRCGYLAAVSVTISPRMLAPRFYAAAWAWQTTALDERSTSRRPVKTAGFDKPMALLFSLGQHC
jgi:hypothetical protein